MFAVPHTGLGLILLASLGLGQSTWHVDDDAPGPGTGTPADPYPSIQAAIDAAATLPGDTVLVEAGSYGPIDFSGKALRIVGGPGRDIAGQGGAPCVVAASGEGAGTWLEGFTLHGGSGRLGALNTSRGGGVLVDGAMLEVVDCEITGNDGGPGLSSMGGGVAAMNAAVVFLRGTRITMNTADTGGGVAVEGAQLGLIDCELEDNVVGGFTGGGDGGGAYVSGGQFVARDTLFEANRAFRGAGARIASGAALFVGCTFRANTGLFGCLEGGAISGAGTVTDCLLEGNFAQFGGALHGGFDVTGSTFRQNGFDQFEASFGGAFHAGGTGAAARATDCTFEENSAFGQGGACHGVTLQDCVLRDNVAFEDGQNFESGLGGGAYRGSATDCRFEGNATVDSGNPFLDDQGGAAHSALLVRCVLRGNTSSEGGGAYACSVDRCTVIANTAAVAGGGLLGGVQVRSSIVGLNSPDQIASAAPGLPAVTYSDVEGGASGVGNIDLDPLFFGPAAGDYYLLPGSPCIDAGDPGSLDPDGTRADMGAFPFDPLHASTPGSYCSAKVTSAGCEPSIAGIGTPSLSGAGFTCVASNVIGGTVGLVFWSRAPRDLPYAGGMLCVGGSLVRTPPVAASGNGPCDGVLTRAFPGAALTAAGLAPGERMYLQWFFRDAAQPDGTGLGISDGLEATIVP